MGGLTATDIPFVADSSRSQSAVPGLKIFLLTLAIADDLGAVLVIGFAYTEDLHVLPLVLAGVGAGLVVVLRSIGVRAVSIYTFVGIGIWFGFLKSGVHPTLAGVLLGLLTPARPLVRRRVRLDIVGDLFPACDRRAAIAAATERFACRTDREQAAPCRFCDYAALCPDQQMSD